MTLISDLNMAHWQSFLTTVINILILLIIPILKYHGIQKEVGFTGLCSNHVTLYRESIG